MQNDILKHVNGIYHFNIHVRYISESYSRKADIGYTCNILGHKIVYGKCGVMKHRNEYFMLFYYLMQRPKYSSYSYKM